ncbi:unnamed protein product, partial [Closterium sp. NIES-53]
GAPPPPSSPPLHLLLLSATLELRESGPRLLPVGDARAAGARGAGVVEVDEGAAAVEGVGWAEVVAGVGVARVVGGAVAARGVVGVVGEVGAVEAAVAVVERCSVGGSAAARGSSSRLPRPSNSVSGTFSVGGLVGEVPARTSSAQVTALARPVGGSTRSSAASFVLTTPGVSSFLTLLSCPAGLICLGRTLISLLLTLMLSLVP